MGYMTTGDNYTVEGDAAEFRCIIPDRAQAQPQAPPRRRRASPPTPPGGTKRAGPLVANLVGWQPSAGAPALPYVGKELSRIP